MLVIQTTNIGIIILAAGSSSRLGTPKQLLTYAGKPLLQHVLQIAIASIAENIIVVLGANEGEIRKEIEWGSSHYTVNPEWQEGIASSIRVGINALVQANPLIDAALLMLCDQPYVTTVLLNQIITIGDNTGKAIVASSYNNTLGVPALFQKRIFPALLQLRGDVGAKTIIQANIKDVEPVPFSQGSVDIDTLTDYQQLQQSIQ